MRLELETCVAARPSRSRRLLRREVDVHGLAELDNDSCARVTGVAVTEDLDVSDGNLLKSECARGVGACSARRLGSAHELRDWLPRGLVDDASLDRTDAGVAKGHR